MGIFGLGLATLLSIGFKIGYLVTHMLCISSLREAYFLPDRSALTNWIPYLRISLPATVMLCSEVWAIEVLGIFAGWISVVDLATNAILITFFAIMFMVPFGAQSAACALIGEKIGANKVDKARQYFKVIAILTGILMISV